MRWSNCGSTICVVKVQLMNSPWADCSWEAEPDPGDPGDPGLPSGLESHREMNHGLMWYLELLILVACLLGRMRWSNGVAHPYVVLYSCNVSP